ncbi:MAG TPA: hypothetical protein VLJ11_05830 [Bryobacteraceae bacterium]|nr:hypothetical protein [Bryobacteraceae bacterium]
MARGWESKDVESQMEEREESRQRQALEKHLDSQTANRKRERESLELSRVRVLRDLEAAQNPKYREMLQRSLDHLNEKLSLLDSLAD